MIFNIGKAFHEAFLLYQLFLLSTSMIHLKKRILFANLIIYCLASFHLVAQNHVTDLPEAFTITVKNPLDANRTNVLVTLKSKDLKKQHPSFNKDAFIVTDGSKELESQWSTNGQEEALKFLLEEIAAKTSKEITIKYSQEGNFKKDYPKRTQAELSHKTGGKFENRVYKGGTFQNVDSLRVPDEHTDHSFFIRYEGPGWESDKVGYRYYLDWRNAIDVFGKKTGETVLQKVGQDGFDSYHEMRDWGMDVLKVGKALGVGSLAYFHSGKANRVDQTDSVVVVIRENGNIYSEIETQYYGWEVAGQKLDLKSELNIHAGSRLTRHEIQIEKGNPEHLSTGIGKDKSVKVFSDKGTGKSWGYLASYGKQSLNDDDLGLAVLFPPRDFIGFNEDQFSHVVNLKPSDNQIEYYFLAAWVLEPEGIKNEKEFIEYLQKTAKELANPLEVKILPGNKKAKAQK